MEAFAASLMTLLFASTTAGQPSQPVPSAFVGKWVTDLEACGPWITESTLEISDNAIELYAAGGPVTSVVMRGTDEIAVVARFLGEEDESWDESMFLRLSPDGTRLMRGEVPGDGSVYYRCGDRDDKQRSSNAFKPAPL